MLDDPRGDRRMEAGQAPPGRTACGLAALLLGLGCALALLGALGGGARAAACGRSPVSTGVLTVCLPAAGTCPYTSVQAAVDAAPDGALIQVAAGVYTDVHRRVYFEVVYVTKTVSIRGGYTTTNGFAGPPDPVAYPTVLDAGGQGRVVYVDEGGDLALEGLSITNGDMSGFSEGGGGLYAFSATVAMTGCSVYGNAANVGGGIGLDDSDASIRGTSFWGNSANWDGGALVASGCDAVATLALEGNTFVSNTAGSWGGGVYLSSWLSGTFTATLRGNTFLSNTSQEGGGLWTSGVHVTLVDNTFAGNMSTTSLGGGAALWYASYRLYSNTFTSNTADDQGGGLFVYGYETALVSNTFVANTSERDAFPGGGGLFVIAFISATLEGNVALSNTTGGDGGGFYVQGNVLTLTRNVAARNSAARGGGVYLYGEDALLANNVIVDNQASLAGSGLYLAGSQAILLHTTIARNGGAAGEGVSAAYYGEPAYRRTTTLAMTNTILVSHTIGISVGEGCTATVAGILWDAATPVTLTRAVTSTVEVSGQLVGDPAFAADGYHLTAGSAAVNRGLGLPVGDDVDGDRRPSCTAPDLGADEYVFAYVTYFPLVAR